MEELFTHPAAQAALQEAARREAGEAAPDDAPCSFSVAAPKQQSLPLVCASPHSGRDYPASFVAHSRLDPKTLRRSEDCFVDRLFDFAPELGAPLLSALFPRAYVDANREPYELDPAMFADRLPDYANTRSPRVAAGLGTIAKVVAGGAEIYGGKLSFAEAKTRIDRHYWPYHRRLERLLRQTRERFGGCLLLDCHSMPSAGALRPVAGDAPLGFVLGDCHGSACDARIVEAAEAALRKRGYRVARNQPYSGGFVTRHYGRPAEGINALQIEINRALYMDEERLEPTPAFDRLRGDLKAVARLLGDYCLDLFER